MNYDFKHFRLAEIINGKDDPRTDEDGGRGRLLKRVKEYTKEMLAEHVSFDDCSYWDELESQTGIDDDDDDDDDEDDDDDYGDYNVDDDDYYD